MAGILDFLSRLGVGSSEPAGAGGDQPPEGVRKIFGMPVDEARNRLRAIGAGLATESGATDDKWAAMGRGFGGAQKHFGDQEALARKEDLLRQQQEREDNQWNQEMELKRAVADRQSRLDDARIRQLEKGEVTDFDRRRKEAADAGLSEDDPAYRSFVLTGKMPREDQAPLTATDKKAILEADEMVAANEGALNALDHAISISGKANEGYGASLRAGLGNNLPDGMVPDFISSPDSSAATADFDNAVVGQALQQLKATFGAAPTEGERKILLELQGSSNLPHEVRVKILERAKAMAERRLDFNRNRAAQLRGGSFYKPQQDSALQQPVLSDPETGVSGGDAASTGKRLRFNPDTGELE